MSSGKHTFGDNVIDYFSKLRPPKSHLPSEVEWINPYPSDEVMTVVKEYYRQFYSTGNSRIYIYGINPGRFGAGVTGISFTDPVQLKKSCNIDHHFHSRSELSSIFIYDDLISTFGGPQLFFENFYITSVCPLGFVRGGKNYNYYDSPELLS